MRTREGSYSLQCCAARCPFAAAAAPLATTVAAALNACQADFLFARDAFIALALMQTKLSVMVDPAILNILHRHEPIRAMGVGTCQSISPAFAGTP